MKKGKMIVSILLAFIVVQATSIMFIYSYESMSMLSNSLVLLLNIIASMYFVKVLLSLFNGKIKKEILNVIFFAILFLTVFVGIVTFCEFIWHK